LRKTWEAVPEPRIVIAVGTEAISGGVFAGHPQVHPGAASVLPVDLFIPGWPPHPLTILDGLLRLLGRLEENSGGGPTRQVEPQMDPERSATTEIQKHPNAEFWNADRRKSISAD
jgi:Ni,Fe-hydrogenase III small subunit